MADIFDEVDEELKRDQMQVLWARYGKYLIAAVSIVVIGVAGRQGYYAWQANQAEIAATAYHQAIQADDLVTAMADADGDLTAGYRMLSRFRSAAALAAKKDLATAEAAYLALAEHADITPLYRQAALLLSVMNAPDDRDLATLRERLGGLEGAAGPLQAMAMEQAAGVALRAGDRAAALAKYQALSGLAEIPADMRQRARRLVDILGG